MSETLTALDRILMFSMFMLMSTITIFSGYGAVMALHAFITGHWSK